MAVPSKPSLPAPLPGSLSSGTSDGPDTAMPTPVVGACSAKLTFEHDAGVEAVPLELAHAADVRRVVGDCVDVAVRGDLDGAVVPRAGDGRSGRPEHRETGEHSR